MTETWSRDPRCTSDDTAIHAIFDMYHNCSSCAQQRSRFTKEPMKSLPVTTPPWQIISEDIFMHRQKAYLVTVCNFSDWIHVDELDDTLATTVINKTKAQIARFGIPHICVCIEQFEYSQLMI